MIDLSLIYTTTDEVGSAQLACQEHPEWGFDADGTNLPDVIKAARDHVYDEHRAHVPVCVCRGSHLVDSRCIPTTERQLL